jgi:hypothetical protein
VCWTVFLKDFRLTLEEVGMNKQRNRCAMRDALSSRRDALRMVALGSQTMSVQENRR